MPYARRWKWVQSATGAGSQRSAAAVIGVTQGTLSRWLKSGMPVGSLTPLIVRFECDPIEALVVWGYLNEEDIAKLNYAALAKYIPGDVLTCEVHARYVDYLSKEPDPYQKTSVGMLRRA